MTYRALPPAYALAKTVDMQADRALFLRAAGITAAAAAVMVLAAVFFVPFSEFVSFSSPGASDAIRLLLLVPAIAFYALTHELLHGLFFRRAAKVKPKYGFSGLSLFVTGDVFFDRRSHLVFSFTPILVWFILLLALDLILPRSLFWFFYILQIVNLCSGVRDLCVAIAARAMPNGLLIRELASAAEFYLRVETIRRE